MSQGLIPRFYHAIKDGDVAVLQAILEDHPPFLHQKVGLETWMNIAGRYGSIPVIEFLIQAGLEPTPALGEAVRYDRVDVACWLLDHGAQIVPPSEAWGGPLLAAVAMGPLEMVELLLERGADPNTSWGTPPQSALEAALARGRTDIAELLLAHGAVPTPTPELPLTPRDEIVRHFATTAGPVEPLSITEIVPGDVAVSIHLVPPAPGHGYLLLFTTGMSDLPLTVPAGLEAASYAELLFLLPGDWDLTPGSFAEPRNAWVIEWLRRAAHHFHEQRTWIGPGYGVLANGNPPEPLAPHVPFDSLFLFHPRTDSAQICLADGRVILCYTVYPLHPEERLLESREGPAALLDRLAPQASFPIVDVHRPSAVG